MTDFSDFDKAVGEFFNDFGFEATFLKAVDGTYNTATGRNEGATTSEIPVEAILMDLTLQSNGLSTKFGTLVQAGDKELYLRPTNKTDPVLLPLVITPGKDKVKVSGVVYNIVTMKEINTTASEPLLFDLYIRR
jgi:hypothetical protein